MAHDTERLSAWRALRREDAPLGLRLAMSFVSALLASALALFGVWAFVLLIRSSPASFPGGPRFGVPRIRDDDVAIAFGLASLVWLAALVWIWGGFRRDRGIVRAAIGTLGIGIVALLVGVMIDANRLWEGEYMIGAVVFVAGAASVWLWTVSLMRSMFGRSMTNEANEVVVNCPDCGYSLRGLTALRCPECGVQFTIDALIQRQNYAVLRGPRLTLARPAVPPEPGAASQA